MQQVKESLIKFHLQGDKKIFCCIRMREIAEGIKKNDKDYTFVEYVI